MVVVEGILDWCVEAGTVPVAGIVGEMVDFSSTSSVLIGVELSVSKCVTSVKFCSFVKLDDGDLVESPVVTKLNFVTLCAADGDEETADVCSANSVEDISFVVSLADSILDGMVVVSVSSNEVDTISIEPDDVGMKDVASSAWIEIVRAVVGVVFSSTSVI